MVCAAAAAAAPAFKSVLSLDMLSAAAAELVISLVRCA